MNDITHDETIQNKIVISNVFINGTFEEGHFNSNVHLSSPLTNQNSQQTKINRTRQLSDLRVQILELFLHPESFLIKSFVLWVTFSIAPIVDHFTSLRWRLLSSGINFMKSFTKPSSHSLLWGFYRVQFFNISLTSIIFWWTCSWKEM
jgi:hypothetical protein